MRWAEWRDYRTASGARVVLREFRALSDIEYADVRAGMDEVATVGMSAARHLRGDVYEVRAGSETGVRVRVLFAQEGRRRKILLSLSVFRKKTRRTPLDEIEKAERRLADWRRRATPQPRAPRR
jgi:phage-related protein